MTLYTRRLIVVVRSALRAAANQAAAEVDTDGGLVFTAALRQKDDATNAAKACWAGWSMTPSEVSALRGWLQAKGATAGEVVVVPASQRTTFTPTPGARAYFFDARPGGWTPAEVCAALKLEPPKVALAGAP